MELTPLFALSNGPSIITSLAKIVLTLVKSLENPHPYANIKSTAVSNINAFY